MEVPTFLYTNWVDLEIPEPDAEDDFELDANKGIIYSPVGFPFGNRNIRVDYTAGYSTYPNDLTMAIKILIKYFYQKRDDETFGLSSYSTGGISATFEGIGFKEFPFEVKAILNKYRRTSLRGTR